RSAPWTSRGAVARAVQTGTAPRVRGCWGDWPHRGPAASTAGRYGHLAEAGWNTVEIRDHVRAFGGHPRLTTALVLAGIGSGRSKRGGTVGGQPRRIIRHCTTCPSREGRPAAVRRGTPWAVTIRTPSMRLSC